jgi:hypothetical protein
MILVGRETVAMKDIGDAVTLQSNAASAELPLELASVFSL